MFLGYGSVDLPIWDAQKKNLAMADGRSPRQVYEGLYNSMVAAERGGLTEVGGIDVTAHARDVNCLGSFFSDRTAEFNLFGKELCKICFELQPFYPSFFQGWDEDSINKICNCKTGEHFAVTDTSQSTFIRTVSGNSVNIGPAPESARPGQAVPESANSVRWSLTAVVACLSFSILERNL